MPSSTNGSSPGTEQYCCDCQSGQPPESRLPVDYCVRQPDVPIEYYVRSWTALRYQNNCSQEPLGYESRLRAPELSISELTPTDRDRYDRPVKGCMYSSSTNKDQDVRPVSEPSCVRDKMVSHVLLNATPRIIDILKRELERLAAAEGLGQDGVGTASVDTAKLDGP